MKITTTFIFILFGFICQAQQTVIELNQPQSQTQFEVAKRQAYTPSGGKTTLITAQGSTLFTQIKKENSLPNYQLLAYPNPAHNQITVQVPGLEKSFFLEMFDINGKLVFQKQLQNPTNHINTAEIPNGLYVLQARTANQIIGVKRVIVN